MFEIGIFKKSEAGQGVGKNVPSDTENPSKKETVRNEAHLDNLGDAKLCAVDLRFRHLIGRCSLAEMSRSDKMCFVRYLRATPKFEFIEVSINGGEPEWAKLLPCGLGVDFGCSQGNITVRFVYDGEEDFITEKIPLDDGAVSGEGD